MDPSLAEVCFGDNDHAMHLDFSIEWLVKK